MNEDYLNKMNTDKSKYVKVLKVLKEVFDKHNIHYWLDYGTLWGAIRDDEILRYDNDVDVGVWKEYVSLISKTKKDFLKKRYILRVNKNHLNYELADINGKEMLCILFRTKTDKYAYRMHFFPFVKIILLVDKLKGYKIISFFWKVIIRLHLYNDKEVTSTLETLGNFKKIKFYDDYHRVPEHPEKYLSWLYKNWKKVLKGPASTPEMRNIRRLKELRNEGRKKIE